MSFMHVMLKGNNQQTAQNARETVSEGHYLSSIIIEQNIIQAVSASIETVNGTKCKFKAQMEAIKNVAEISGQNTICVALSK